MSYLFPPRLHFAGRFQADVPTINNDPEHYDSRCFRPIYERPSDNAVNGWWNPRGSGAWRLLGCTVQRVVYRDGSATANASDERLIGVPINDALMRVEGKMVDLDSEQQSVSEIWGFHVVVGQGERSPGFRGEFAPAAFADLWPRYAKGLPDSNFSAFYQSVIEPVEWRSDGDSRFLRELRDKGEPPRRLSIRFTVDGVNQDSTSPEFCTGRIVGSIGLCHTEEPRHFVAGRRLGPLPGSPLEAAYGQIQDGALWLDLGNSLPTRTAGGPIAELGKLYAAILPPGKAPMLLSRIEHEDPLWYSQTAGIVRIPMTPSQLKLAAHNPLGVVRIEGRKRTVLLSEAANGLFVRADQFVFRFNPPETQTVRLYATRFGQPEADQQISLAHDDSVMLQQATQGPIPGPQTVGEPKAALKFPASISTGPNGVAKLPLKASDPGNPRGYIDGQVYGLTYAAGKTPPAAGSVRNASRMLSALVFSAYQAPEKPVWIRDVQPIFQQYANLYPVMRPIVDLADYASVMFRREMLKTVFALPQSHPNYMPVTRDLSRAKLEMIRRWLERPHYMSLDSADQLLEALQLAIELEHSTIPPYLCALYSLKDGANIEVSKLIQGIVVEEMLHMAQASNLLISLGGCPRMNYPAFVPRYPASMPAGLRRGLTLRLRRCSIHHIRDVFMRMEEPEKTLESSHGEVDPGDPAQAHYFTIGWFYREIAKALVDLSSAGKIHFGHAARQVADWKGPGQITVVTSLTEALEAIRAIMEQGEGSGDLDPSGQSGLAHYYKFAEIVAGRTIVPGTGGRGFAYAGDPIPFDPEGVWPMIDDPGLVPYPGGSRASFLGEQFARTYGGLLNGMHRTFNGHPEYLRETLGMMYSLNLTAKELMRTPSGLQEGTTAGPVFHYGVVE